MEFYCVKLKKKVVVDDKSIEITTMKNGKKAASAVYEENGDKMKLFRILGKEDIKRLGI